MAELDGETALVTGGASGIGRAICRRLAADGAHVVVLDVADGTETVSLVADAGGSAEFREGDVTEEADLAAAVDGLDLDILVNNAAYYAPLVTDKKPFEAIGRAEWETVMAVNVTGPVLAAKHALPRFDDGGSIVTISSGSVLRGVPGFSHYVTSKAAVLGMTRAMATELGELGIRVNAVMPGLVASEATLQAGREAVEARVARQPLGAAVQPADVAAAVSFLAGADGAKLTGQVLNVDGGASYY